MFKVIPFISNVFYALTIFFNSLQKLKNIIVMSCTNIVYLYTISKSKAMSINKILLKILIFNSVIIETTVVIYNSLIA